VPEKKAAVAGAWSGSGSGSGRGEAGTGVEAELAAIVTGIAAGERPALERLYARFGARLYGIAHRILRDEALAEDAIQEAFVKIWRNAARFDPERGSALGWVAIIVRRAAFDLCPREPVAEPADLPSEQPETEMLHPGLARALDSLPESHRRALILMYVYGLTHGELAARMDAPLGTVKSWVRRGATALRDKLAESQADAAAGPY
jgi:RNA polymerase sigma-70 factor (ECF subfamily)